MANVARLAALSVFTWAVVSESHPGLAGRHLAALVLLIAVAVGWLAWMWGRARDSRTLVVGSLILLGVASGGLAGLGVISLIFVGVVGMGAGMAFELLPAVPLAAVGPIAALCGAAFDGSPTSVALGGAGAALGGLVLGTARRQALLATQQSTRLMVERDRAEMERARAAVLAERNRLAREMHDVLAHTLGAMSVQLEALDTLYRVGPDASAAFRAGLARSKQLVTEGLEEARDAVRALREDAVPLAEGLARLCEQRYAALAVSGEPRALPPEVTLALYRVAQEGLTNASKHAPESSVSVSLDFAADAVTVAVLNGPTDSAPASIAAAGAGYGLQGVRERILLLAGQVDAGPTPELGWRLVTTVPA